MTDCVTNLVVIILTGSTKSQIKIPHQSTSVCSQLPTCFIKGFFLQQSGMATYKFCPSSPPAPVRGMSTQPAEGFLPSGMPGLDWTIVGAARHWGGEGVAWLWQRFFRLCAAGGSGGWSVQRRRRLCGNNGLGVAPFGPLTPLRPLGGFGGLRCAWGAWGAWLLADSSGGGGGGNGGHGPTGQGKGWQQMEGEDVGTFTLRRTIWPFSEDWRNRD